jgi:hypothetical protein
MAAHRTARDPQAETDCIAGIGHSEHERVADRLHVLAADPGELCLHGPGELVDELEGVLVTVRLRQRREACDVGKEEGRFGRPLHGDNLIALSAGENAK